MKRVVDETFMQTYLRRNFELALKFNCYFPLRIVYWQVCWPKSKSQAQSVLLREHIVSLNVSTFQPLFVTLAPILSAQ